MGWRDNLSFTLSCDTNFAPYLKSDCVWLKETSTTPARGFVDDAAQVPDNNRKTKEQKVAQLNLMLGQIANYATIISRNQIIKNSTSLANIWSKIREHYCLHVTGSRFLDLTNLRPSVGERPEDFANFPAN